MEPPPSHNLPFEVVEGDIGAHALAHGPWLAVVSSDDSYLSHGGGSSRSIWKAAGLDEFDPREFNLPLPLGSIVSTEPGKPAADAV